MTTPDSTITAMTTLEWHGCYAANWNTAPLVPEAYSHPAKVAFGLARRIYRHLLAQGYVKPGSLVVDPFAGVGGFAFHAMYHGLHFRGCELEEKFVTLANRNFELWDSRYKGVLPNWGTAEIYQGDSRELCRVIGGAGVALSSPPYADSLQSGGREGKIKFMNQVAQDGNGHRGVAPSIGLDYGRTPGQLGAMKEGQPPDAIIGSPPYADAVNGNGEGPGARHDHKFHNGDNATKKSSQAAYGETAGQLGSMAVVGSPPFENKLSAEDIEFYRKKRIQTGRNPDSHHANGIDSYGSTPGNIGNDTGGTFWEAARVIVEQCYQLLPPGGVAVWVTGNFRRDYKVVDFGSQWLSLCESVGFVGLEKIIAWKSEPRPAQADIFGNIHDRDIHRVSFFRRLDNQKHPGNEILSEEVWIVQKPVSLL